MLTSSKATSPSVGDRREHATAQRLAESHEFADSERNPSSVTVHSVSRSRATRFARAPTSILGSSRPNARAGPADIRSSRVSSGDHAGHDEVRVERGEGGLEAGDSERRLLERDVLLVAGVRARDRWRCT